jgi:glycosyltransferase involved in cell wall biosynthesis
MHLQENPFGDDERNTPTEGRSPSRQPRVTEFHLPLEDQARARNAVRTACGIPADQNLILVLDGAEERRSDFMAPRIAARLASVRPQDDWRFVLLDDGGRLTGVLAEAVRLCVAQRFKIYSLVTTRGEPRDLYFAADIGLCASPKGARPAILWEALWSGLPLVAGTIQHHWEIVGAQAGVLCDPCDPAAFAGALAMLLERPRLRLEMGEAAYRQALRNTNAAESMSEAMRDALLAREPRQPISFDVITPLAPRSSGDDTMRQIRIRRDQSARLDDILIAGWLWSHRRR